jgi:hypothetical protein
VPLGRLDDLAHAVYVRGEGGDDDPAISSLEDPVEGLGHHALARHVALPLGVGRVAEVGEHALVSQRCVAREVHRLSLDGGEVYLVIAREDDQTGVGAERQGDRIGDGVVDVYQLDDEAADVYGVARLGLPEVGVFDAELGQLGTHRAQGEPGPVDGDVELAQKVREGADVVLVPCVRTTPRSSLR